MIDQEANIMHVNHCHINMAHDRSFLINRPNGSGDNLFIYTRTPVILMMDGKLQRYPAETTVFFRKGCPQHFMAAGQIYANDYIHFSADDDEMAFIDSLGIPSGVAFTGLDASVFMSIHRYICIEHLTQTKQRDTSVDLLLRYFLIKLSQAVEEATQLTVSSGTKSALRALRDGIYANSGASYSVDGLARQVGLSSSYFQSVYRRMFGRPCMEDVIHARIEQAKTLLLTTEMSVTAVARLCGYESDSHFSRQFKKYVGVTAVSFRRQGEQKDAVIQPDPAR